MLILKVLAGEKHRLCNISPLLVYNTVTSVDLFIKIFRLLVQGFLLSKTF